MELKRSCKGLEKGGCEENCLTFFVEKFAKNKLTFKEANFSVYDVENAEILFLEYLLDGKMDNEKLQLVIKTWDIKARENRILSHFTWRAIHWLDVQHTSEGLRQKLEKVTPRVDLAHPLLLGVTIEKRDTYEYAPNEVQPYRLRSEREARDPNKEARSLPKDDAVDCALEMGIITAMMRGDLVEDIAQDFQTYDTSTNTVWKTAVSSYLAEKLQGLTCTRILAQLTWRLNNWDEALMQPREAYPRAITPEMFAWTMHHVTLPRAGWERTAVEHKHCFHGTCLK